MPPVPWSETVRELNARNMHVLTVQSGGEGSAGWDDAVALAGATDAIDSTGSPYVFAISSTGSGIGSTIVDAVVDLANFSRLDVTVRAVDNPATAIDERRFLVSAVAASWGPGSCTSASGDTFLQCLPGTNVDFRLDFQNSFVTPTSSPQVFDFSIQVIGDDVTVINEVPVRIVVPADRALRTESGSYTRSYDAADTCRIPPERPDYNTLTWRAQTPGRHIHSL